MRFVSLCTVLGAALLPMISAAPCKPNKSTSMLSATTTVESETLSTAATTETSFHSTVTTDATTDITSIIETTITETASLSETTSAVSDYTTESSVTIDTTSIEIMTTTTAETPESTNIISNGDFEDEHNADWTSRTGGIKSDASKARAGQKYGYVQPSYSNYADVYSTKGRTFELVNEKGIGGNNLNQTLNGLDTRRLYRLSFYAAVFSNPAPSRGDTVCTLEALQRSTVIDSWTPDYAALNEYKPFETTFTPVDDDFSFTLRLRCDGDSLVTLSVGIDDVSLYDIGEAPITITPE
ncbi:hypothetical protein FLONG3_1139 [Fusarium longipes]|uniref:CBM-cenC domain-containing protein n=1 Tax=Fusarium longipes TaxID=694270 RepID=A0A395T7D8_9HYPO|nr:hypothetical protein FLONG3_1139 [Fusarium longipes]